MKNVRLFKSSGAVLAAVTFTITALAVLGTGAFTAWADPEGSGDQGNGAPAVNIVSPDEGAMFLVGTKIPIHAFAINFTDSVSSVQFFAGSNSLGTVTNFLLADREHNVELASFNWSNSVAGDYALTAVATDAAGVSVTSAPVDISVVTNFPPVVHIVKPCNNSYILGPTNVTILASASDPDGTIASVTFFAGTNNLGSVTNPPAVVLTNGENVYPVRLNGYSLTWSNAPLGTFILRAVATDNSGIMSTSAPVTLNIVTDLPPVVCIVRPENHACFWSPANITLTASASDPAGGSVSNVEFFANGASVGTVTNGQSVTNRGTVKTYFTLEWNYVLTSNYVVTAVATDSDGESTTSAPVVITVKTPPPPSVRIANPHNGEQFKAPRNNINIVAIPSNFVNPIASITFLAGTNVLDVESGKHWTANYHWRNVPAGNYSLTVIARDVAGASATSAPPVNIVVTTNRPPAFGRN